MLARRMILPIVGVGLLASISVSAEDSPAPKKGRLTAAQCERLVGRLVSRDKPPFDKDHVLRLPNGVDEETLRKKQARVWAA
jgi:hypothetical protein